MQPRDDSRTEQTVAEDRVAAWTPERVAESFDLDYERDYNFASKEEVVRVMWREKGKRARWHKLVLFTSETHPTLRDLIEHRTEYVAWWLNMQAEKKAAVA